MTTPILDFLRAYREGGTARFHMPGHKGKGPLGCEGLDITEIKGADVLYAPDGIIAESEANATCLFGTAHTFYSAEGSTLAIRAMLALAASSAPASNKRPLILAARNAHRAFITAAALLDLRVEWLWGEADEHLCACTVTAEAVAAALERERPAAVYLTSPDYLGNVADIAGIAAVCHERGVPLLVDNAHGAYLAFLDPSRHPIALGADACADSAHKTLPTLTGGAYLHISKTAPSDYVTRARAMLSLFASTSPSYLILASLDAANKMLAEGYSARLADTAAHLAAVRREAEARGFSIVGDEPLKLTLDATPIGYTGGALAAHLRENGIECEYADDRFAVLMVSPENTEADFARLSAALTSLPARDPIALPTPPTFERGEAVLSVREAMLAKAERVSVQDALGRIAATPTVSCPPAVPIVISGERISEASLALLAHYGIEEIEVVIE